MLYEVITYSPIRINDFVSNTLTTLPGSIDFEIYSGADSPPSALLFSSKTLAKRVLPDDYRPTFVYDKVVGPPHLNQQSSRNECARWRPVSPSR